MHHVSLREKWKEAAAAFEDAAKSAKSPDVGIAALCSLASVHAAKMCAGRPREPVTRESTRLRVASRFPCAPQKAAMNELFLAAGSACHRARLLHCAQGPPRCPRGGDGRRPPRRRRALRGREGRRDGRPRCARTWRRIQALAGERRCAGEEEETHRRGTPPPPGAGIVLHEAGKYKPAGYEFGRIPEEALSQDVSGLSPAAAAAFADALRGAAAWRHSHGDPPAEARRWYAAAERVCKGVAGAEGGGAGAIAGKLLAKEVLMNACAGMVRGAVFGPAGRVKCGGVRRVFHHARSSLVAPPLAGPAEPSVGAG